ncbi:MAG: 16S rRNA (adenine(1518)-N(6)/adenine(1519)-N(6))-dimethyltransferase RsmA [Planctomycetota bacterium]|nr:16S rRNA (adenine(1518)-N(6)/adenine(1519)-N(6))-dimethyltransferase RsmA [Planctomycetota bacterium]
MSAAPRQTASFLMQRFREVGLEPDKRRGQNFLIDLNLLEILAMEADITDRDVVLEVGTGLGSLTALMAERAAAVITVEIDKHLQQLASEVLDDFDNVTLLRHDALRNKNNLHPAVIETVQAKLAEAPDRQFKLAANLPYCIATPIISNVLSLPFVPQSMTVTIQKELGDRIVAKPSTKDYSALSIWIQAQCDAKILRALPPQVFWPRPKVDSAIVQIVPNAEKRARIPDLDFFHTFVRSMFFHRRKFLRSVLVAAMKGQLTKPQVDAVLESQELGPTARAEELDVDRTLSLCEAVRQALV